MAHIGIDLGTSNTLVAKVTESGGVEVIEIDGEKMIPSIIFIEEMAGNPVVGEAAKLMWANPDYDQEGGYRRWKLRMGENHRLGSYKPGGESGDVVAVTPETLTKFMVEYVLREISDGLGGERVDSVLVTVPHGWRRETPEKCKATRLAASLASVNGAPVKVQDMTVSEPVAAAAYWIWENELGGIDTFNGKFILVCDVGGGTFDLSMVKVGGADKPLDVVDATNHEYAGDYVDALLCACLCRLFNEAFQTVYPETAESVLTTIADPQGAWLRQWFITVEEMKRDFTLGATRVGINKMRPVKKKFTDADNRLIELVLDRVSMEEILEPFYARGRELVAEFLSKHNRHKIDAVIFCGGGSCIHGVQDKILRPVLASIYEPSEVERILERITVSSGRVDHAIALGAALIANGTVSVQERFLADVGIKQSAANAELRSALGLPVDSEDGAFYLMPIISRGTPLPTSISSEMLKLNCTMKHGETVDVDVLFDNGRGASWVQTWELPHPDIEVGNSDKVDPCSCVWSIEIDADGVLTVSIRSKSGVSKKTGSVSPPRASAGKVMIEVGPTQKVKSDDYPRITCEQLKNTIRDLGSDDCPRITCEQLKTTVQDLGKARKSGGKG